MNADRLRARIVKECRKPGLVDAGKAAPALFFGGPEAGLAERRLDARWESP